MHDNSQLVEQRISRFTAERIVPAIVRDRESLTVTAWQVPGEPVPFADAVGQEFTPVAVGHAWGAPWSTTWFRATGHVPPRWTPDVEDGSTVVEAHVDLGFNAAQVGFQAEGLAWSPEGTVIKSIQPLNRYVAVTTADVDFYIEAAGNPTIGGSDISFAPTPMGDVLTAPDEPLYRLSAVDVVLIDVTVRELWHDVRILSGLLAELPRQSTRRARVLRALESMCDTIDPHQVALTAQAGRDELAGVLSDPASASAHVAYAVGHAHIDSAWLWPVRETVRKCARTFSSQVALMDEDPDLCFAASSAQQYLWIEQHYPELFERIRQKVAEGRFVPVGSMWVESDTNMPGSEALARQFIAGKSYFLSRFGIETTDVWLPDSFGYTGALPQIARAAGSKYFLSQKLSWNESNRMPHHTFTWAGIDGSEVFAHFPPVDTYNSDLSPRELLHAEREYREKGVATRSLVPFGWGDGGGGPTRDMLAAAHRAADLEGLPRVRLSDPNRFFADAQEEYPHPPTWMGEMYLEFHRGTYTAQAKMKQGNRRSEHLLREAELWATTAALRAGRPYPYEDLERIWHQVLLYQFHDILPGSSIGWVHREAEEEYPRLAAELETIIAAATSDLVGEGDRVLVLNAAPHPHHEVPALGASTPCPSAAAPVEVTTQESGTIVLDNGLIRVTVTPQGTVSSLVDLGAPREVIPVGSQANLLQLHLDTPRAWDAWDVDVEYRRFVTNLVDVDSLEVSEHDGEATVTVSRSFGSSTVTQSLTVVPGSAAITVVADVDWHEKQKLLKLSFPVVLLTDRSAAETQFGHVYRPTHANTSWDANKFEICAHRWVHVDEAGYGVAVANDATYGHDITRVVPSDGRPHTDIRLSLLKSALFPDPRADEGRHQFTAVLHPGATIADAVRDGYQLNLGRREIVGANDIAPIVAVDAPGVVIESVKLAEDRSGDVVVRLYESRGGRGDGSLVPGFTASSITQVDLLEREIPADGVSVVGDIATVALRPFQIVTVRIRPAA